MINIKKKYSNYKFIGLRWKIVVLSINLLVIIGCSLDSNREGFKTSPDANVYESKKQ